MCDAAIDSGGMTTAALLMPKPGSDLMEVRAMAGYGRKVLEETVISISPDRPEGRGLNGTAFRTCQPAVSNDYYRDRRTGPWHQQMRSRTLLKAVAAVPILLEGNAIGTLHLCSREKNAFDKEIVGLLVRMAENIAFALQAFDREQVRREAEERAHYLATHCSLTGLPNRNLLTDLLEQAIASVNRTGHNPALMFVDLDNFKQINDTWGHDAGDRVLEQMAGRLRCVLREHDVLARLGAMSSWFWYRTSTGRSTRSGGGKVAGCRPGPGSGRRSTTGGHPEYRSEPLSSPRGNPQGAHESGGPGHVPGQG